MHPQSHVDRHGLESLFTSLPVKNMVAKMPLVLEVLEAIVWEDRAEPRMRLFMLCRPRPAFLSTSAKRSEQGQQTTSAPRPQQHGGEQQKKTGSIRPFTVLALFVPLGYALSWATNGGNGSTASSSADGFVRYTLARKEDVSSTSAIFTLEPATSSDSLARRSAAERAITSVQIKQPQLQIARNYTLLPSDTGTDSANLDLLIRKERNGEVSGYLHRLPLGSDIEVRGPVVDFAFPEGVDEVVFLAGGTGIVPAMQVAKALAGQARMHVLWASRCRQDCVGGISDTPPPQSWTSWLKAGIFGFDAGQVKEIEHDRERSRVVLTLEQLKLLPPSGRTAHESPQLLVDYYVDDEDTFIQPGDIQRSLQSAYSTTQQPGGRKLLLISGPEGFINYWAGPKQWLNGREAQGPLGGVLSTMSLAGWEVVKL
ncbi:uncharacterized protein LTR77_002747 [Saxophila tyrrhenica]|uniref:FAD-binding FR-type domain-containing protein n=1 Tax=Saxophila tyrrhenica TaxID=1690608 RepID=A0AAV9PIZ5_9PEZI|nr:hypothetical protein LTR77_002747 [Saxophila tyrrhenica]